MEEGMSFSMKTATESEIHVGGLRSFGLDLRAVPVRKCDIPVTKSDSTLLIRPRYAKDTTTQYTNPSTSSSQRSKIVIQERKLCHYMA
jgi:hypothetical protein